MRTPLVDGHVVPPASLIRIDDIQLTDGAYRRPPGLDPTDASVEKIAVPGNSAALPGEPAAPPGSIEKISGSPRKVKYILLRKYLHNLQAICTLAQEYLTVKDVERAKPAWDMYKSIAAH